MEQKLVKVPFNIEMAKKITNEEVKGRIVTHDGECVFRIVCFDLLDDKGKIIALRKNDNYNETVFTFDDYGCCVQNSNYILMLEVPEYLAFKDGDVVKFSHEDCSWITVIKDIEIVDNFYFSNDYVTLMLDGEYSCPELEFDSYSDSAIAVKKPTDKEIQKLIDAIKTSKEPKAKEYLKRFFGIEHKDATEFKPGQPVIGINGIGKWRYDFFSHIDDSLYVCTGGSYKRCLPFNDKTAHLLGTNKDYKEE